MDKNNTNRTRRVSIILKVELEVEKQLSIENIDDMTEEWIQEQIEKGVANAHEELFNKLGNLPGFKYHGSSIRESEYTQWNTDGSVWSND